MTISTSRLTLLALLLTAGLMAPGAAFAMGQRPDATPSAPAEANPATSIVDMEEAAHHLLILGPRLKVETTKGAFTLVTFPKEAPRTVEQIVRLVESGFYDGLAFHRVVPGFVVQVGDPQSRSLGADDPKIGRGGSGQVLPPEFQGQTVKHMVGTLSMARARDPNSADSQFYVSLAPAPHLDGQYTIWGQIESGMDTVRGLTKGDKITRVTVVPQAPQAK